MGTTERNNDRISAKFPVQVEQKRLNKKPDKSMRATEISRRRLKILVSGSYATPGEPHQEGRQKC